jgi:hypothetical protein
MDRQFIIENAAQAIHLPLSVLAWLHRRFGIEWKSQPQGDVFHLWHNGNNRDGACISN